MYGSKKGSKRGFGGGVKGLWVVRSRGGMVVNCVWLVWVIDGEVEGLLFM